MPTKKQLQVEIERLRKAARTQRAPDMLHFGGVLQMAREGLGFGIQELARESGLSAGLITRAEVRGSIELKTLKRLAQGLGIRPSSLLMRWEASEGYDPHH